MMDNNLSEEAKKVLQAKKGENREAGRSRGRGNLTSKVC